MTGDDYDEPEYTDVLGPDSRVGMVETRAELGLRTARDGGTAYVKDEGRFYVFKNGQWEPEEEDEA